MLRACLILLSGILAGCGLKQTERNAPTVTVNAARYGGAPHDPLRAACQRWRLTSAQVERFFAISQRYSDTPYDRYYLLPCDITGTLHAEQRMWIFEINAGGTATWRSGEEIRHWGCSANECAAMVLLQTDGMRGARESIGQEASVEPTPAAARFVPSMEDVVAIKQALRLAMQERSADDPTEYTPLLAELDAAVWFSREVPRIGPWKVVLFGEEVVLVRKPPPSPSRRIHSATLKKGRQGTWLVTSLGIVVVQGR